jgi:single-strand DNA-binding protein
MLNEVILSGRLVRDPELRYTPSGVAVGRFTLAVSRDYKNANGERDADFISCVIWRGSAERFCNWFRKGSRVEIRGRLQTGKYETEDGSTRYTTDVNVEKFYNLDRYESTGQGEDPANDPYFEELEFEEEAV